MSKFYLKISENILRLSRFFSLDLNFFIRNSFWIGMRQAVASLCGLALSVFFARLASQETYGQYQFVLLIMSVISLVSLPGINTAVNRSVARKKEGDYETAVSTSFRWSLLGVPILLMIGFGYFFQDSKIGTAIIFSAFFFPLIYAPNTWQSFLFGKSFFNLYARYSSYQIVVNTFFIILAIILTRNNDNQLFFVILIYLVTYAFSSVFLYYKTKKYKENCDRELDTISYGKFLTKMSILQVISNNFDQIILGVFISPASLAAYHIISLLPTRFKSLLKPFFNLFFPKMSLTKETALNMIKKKKKATFFFLAVSFLGTLAFYFFIVPIQQFLFGEKYSDYYEYSKYFAVLIFIFIPLNMMSKYVYAKKYHSVIKITSIHYPITKMVISLIFIVKWGLLGAVLSYNINIIIWFLMYGISLWYKEVDNQQEIKL